MVLGIHPLTLPHVDCLINALQTIKRGWLVFIKTNSWQAQSEQFCMLSIYFASPILCLIQRTTVTSLNTQNDILCKTHSLCVKPGILYWTVRKHTCYANDNKHLSVEYALTSRSFSRWDKVRPQKYRQPKNQHNGTFMLMHMVIGADVAQHFQ